MAAVGAVAVLLLVALILLVMPKSGTLIVTVAGPNNRRIDSVEVFVDGAKKCPFSPCKVEGLDKGAHTIRVTAAGYADTADKVVEVGKETIVPFELALASEGTGIRVTAEGSGLKLFVDGAYAGGQAWTTWANKQGGHGLNYVYPDDTYGKEYNINFSVCPLYEWRKRILWT